MADTAASLPRHDFYQTPEYVIVAVYIKGLNVAGVKEAVDIRFEPKQAVITRPNPDGEADSKLTSTFGPLFAGIKPEGSTSRILSTKIELKLAKADELSWPTLFATSGTPAEAPKSSEAAPADPSASSSSAGAPLENIGPAQSSGPHIGGPAKINNKRKNWDRVVEEELKVKKEDQVADPNAGGDDALQKMFAGIYKDADPDTRRAMIKSFTESGGTTLSTDWASIGKEKTPIRPPDGMEARKY